MIDKGIGTIKGVIFDLDNTLVSSSIDFQKLKQSLGCDIHKDILEFVNEIKCAKEKEHALGLILESEFNDAKSSSIIDGAYDLIDFLNANNLPTSIVTRNSAQSSRYKIQKHKVDIKNVISRELFPPKPDPAALNHIAKQWQIPSESIIYVGDYLYDIQAAKNANMHACLITHGIDKPYEGQADIVVKTLSELKTFLMKFKLTTNSY